LFPLINGRFTSGRPHERHIARYASLPTSDLLVVAQFEICRVDSLARVTLARPIISSMISSRGSRIAFNSPQMATTHI